MSFTNHGADKTANFNFKLARAFKKKIGHQSLKENIWSVPFSFYSDFQIVSMAAAPDRQCPVECMRYFVCLSSHHICWSGCFGLVAPALRLWLGGPVLVALISKGRPGSLGLGGPGLEALPWRSWPGGLGLEALSL